jgi:hypothetical protein
MHWYLEHVSGIEFKIRMMRHLYLIIGFLFPTGSMAQGIEDSVAIVQLLKADYGTMVAYDIKKHREYCTSDYLLIENGEIWDMEKEAEWYKKNVHRSLQRRDYFNFKLLKVQGSSAYAVYELKSEFIENEKLTTRQWNESAVFRKVNDQWKIALIHSSPLGQVK